MKKLFAIVSLSLLILPGCKKEKVEECEANNTATLQIQSHESEEYEIVIDGTSYGNIEPDESKYVTCPAGHVNIQFFEVNYNPGDGQQYYSGYMDMSSCGTYPISFGN